MNGIGTGVTTKSSKNDGVIQEWSNDYEEQQEWRCHSGMI